jgi:hypothetical protein
MTGERSMKSTLSSASQWKDFRNSSSTNRATNLGEKSSLEIQGKTFEYSRQRLFFFSVSVLRIQSVYPASRIRTFPSRIQGQKAPNPGSGSAKKNLGIFNPIVHSSWKYDLDVCSRSRGKKIYVTRIQIPNTSQYL